MSDEALQAVGAAAARRGAARLHLLLEGLQKLQGAELPVPVLVSRDQHRDDLSTEPCNVRRDTEEGREATSQVYVCIQFASKHVRWLMCEACTCAMLPFCPARQSCRPGSPAVAVPHTDQLMTGGDVCLRWRRRWEGLRSWVHVCARAPALERKRQTER